MQFPFNVPTITNHQLAVKTSPWVAPQLLIDGQPAPRGPQRGQFLVRDDAGTEVLVELRGHSLLKPVPDVVIGSETIQLAPPLRWYEVVWSGLPLIMVIPGLAGAFGVFFGLLGYGVNHQIFRSNRGRTFKFLTAGGVTLGVSIAWLVAVTLANVAIDRIFPPTPKPFVSAAGGFRVDTPVTFAERIDPVATRGGQIDNHVFTGDHGNDGYVVSYADFTAEQVPPSEPATLIENTKDGVVRALKARIVSEQAVTVSGQPGHEVIMRVTDAEHGDLIVKLRVILAPNRLYQVMALSKGTEVTDRMRAFVASFAITGA